MKNGMKTLVGCLMACACAALMLTACERDDDWHYDRPGGGYTPSQPGGGGDVEDNSAAGAWKGKLRIKYNIYDWTFTSTEEYILITPHENNSSIGTGEMICFYDDPKCPVEWESIYFTWYVSDGTVNVSVPCDANLNSTIGGLSVKNGILSGIISGASSDVFELERLKGFDKWGNYGEETKYGAGYRDVKADGQWTGVMGTYYRVQDTDETYDADYANIKFNPSAKDALRGDGEEIDFYKKPCPVKYESFHFTWESDEGMLFLTYPYNEDLNIDLYDIVIDGNRFYCRYDNGEAEKVISLTKLTDYKDWGLYNPTDDYGCAYYETMVSQRRKAVSARRGMSRRETASAPIRSGRRSNQ